MQRFRSACALTILAIVLPLAGSCQSSSSIAPQSSAAPTTIVAPSPSVPSPSPIVEASASIEASDARIWAQLRQSRGYVILFRHALAPGTGDPPNFRLNDCSTQRNLSAEGRQQAIRMGEILRRQNIVVSRVLSSQWCRCLETAQLMSVGQVEPFPTLNSFFQNHRTDRTQTEQLRQLILKNRDTPGVMVMVTHQVNITAISHIIPQSGAGVVMRATDDNQLKLIGQLEATGS